MLHQQKDEQNSINKILNEKQGVSNFKDTRIRQSKDFAFYGVTKTQAGNPEISLALKLILKDGSQLLIQYHELNSPMKFDGSTQIELHTHSLNIVIRGARLEPLFDYLAEHRLMWVKEPDSDFVQVKEAEPRIERIEVEKG